jgi:hypothetical protein
MIDVNDVRPRSKDMDIDELNSLLIRLVGNPFLFFRESYGEELTIHLGKSVPYQSPKMKHLRMGTYRLCTRASLWVLGATSPTLRVFISSESVNVTSGNPRVKRMDLSAIEAEKTIRPGSLVTEVHASESQFGLALTMSFLDGSQFVILPLPDEDELEKGEEELANWQIFMPGHRLLRAWPDGSWSYTDSRAKPLMTLPDPVT